MTPKQHYFKTVSHKLNESNAKETFLSRNHKQILKRYNVAKKANILPDEEVIDSTKHLFTSDEWTLLQTYIETYGTTFNIQARPPQYALDMFYNRIKQTLKTKGVPRARLLRYLEEELEIHPEDAKTCMGSISGSYLRNEFPSIEAIILVSDLFHKDEIATILHHANRTQLTSSSSTAISNIIETTVLYAQKYRPKSAAKKRAAVNKQQKAITNLEFNWNAD